MPPAKKGNLISCFLGLPLNILCGKVFSDRDFRLVDFCVAFGAAFINLVTRRQKYDLTRFGTDSPLSRKENRRDQNVKPSAAGISDRAVPSHGREINFEPRSKRCQKFFFAPPVPHTRVRERKWRITYSRCESKENSRSPDCRLQPGAQSRRENQNLAIKRERVNFVGL